MTHEYSRAITLASRVAAALIGGYALAYFGAGALARLLPLANSEAVVVASLLGLLLYALAIMGVFAARSAGRAWGVLVMLVLPCAAIMYLPGMPS